MERRGDGETRREEMKDVRMVPNRLEPEVYKALENIVGSSWISQDRAVAEAYSKLSLDAEGFLKKHHKDPSNIFACVVLPGSTGEVQSIVRVANRYRVPSCLLPTGRRSARQRLMCQRSACI